MLQEIYTMLAQIIDRCLSPLGLVIRRRSSWDAMVTQLETARKEVRMLLKLLPPQERALQMRELWNELARKSKFGFISHLQPGAVWEMNEFAKVGERFVDRMVERFSEYGGTPLRHDSICEIGCGVGRFLKPLSSHFKHVIGVDVSKEMLGAAHSYCSKIGNVDLVCNNGMDLGAFKTASIGYCVSAGVLQHITDFRIIASYLIDSVRILRPGGVFLFQFEGNRGEDVGTGQIGAKITARRLDEALAGNPFQICEVSLDSEDPIKNVVIVIRRTRNADEHLTRPQRFQEYPLTDRPWLSGVYDDITTKTHMHVRLLTERATLTFYD